MPYDAKQIEEKWQRAWGEARVAEVDVSRSGDKYYMLNMFPYPSGDLHVGHGRNYILGDALYRYLRMRGHSALNPMGWDAFGLPAENAAIKRGIHPRQWTLGNIVNMKRQFMRWGILYDWSKELASCEPEYYRWNQWLFLQLYKRGLAYRGKAPVNWCPTDQTVLAPEHPDVAALIADASDRAELERWIESVRCQSALERQEAGKEGRFSGKYATNPFTKEPIPIWLGNFVLLQYGTAAIMAVPGHDQRDFEFAKQYDLPIRIVVVPNVEPALSRFESAGEPALRQAFVENGVSVDSGVITGLPTPKAIERIIAEIERLGIGKKMVRYRLRDWLISRQRYWGTPIPVLYCDKCDIVLVQEDQLPVVLPLDVPFTGREGNSLAKDPNFVNATCPKCGGSARRETDTMDTFVDSSWYYARFISARDDKQIFDSRLVNRWLPVDQYIGGIEHAILHLLYARFICRTLYDMGLVNFEEPFTRLFNQGMITKEGYRDPSDNLAWVPLNEVELRDGKAYRGGHELVPEMGKM